MNSEFIAQQSAAIAERAMSETAESHEIIEWLFTRLLGRHPTDEELSVTVRHARQLQNSETPVAAWAGITRTLLSSNEFLFID